MYIIVNYPLPSSKQYRNIGYIHIIITIHYKSLYTNTTSSHFSPIMVLQPVDNQ